MLGDPGFDLVGVEAEHVSPLDVGDPPLLDEAADVADVDAEPVGDFGDGQQWTAMVSSGRRPVRSVRGSVVVVVMVSPCRWRPLPH